MFAPTIGLVTIGQSPRPDIRTAYAAILGPAIRIIEAGALDGLERADVHRLQPGDDDTPLVTLFNG